MNDQVTENFKLSEFACKCGNCENLINVGFIQALQKLRDEYGKPLTITSGYRCPAHNAVVGGAKHSYHMKGLAADIAVTGASERYQIVKRAIELGVFGGIGISSGFVHLDIRTSVPVMFTY